MNGLSTPQSRYNRLDSMCHSSGTPPACLRHTSGTTVPAACLQRVCSVPDGVEQDPDPAADGLAGLWGVRALAVAPSFEFS